MQVRASLLQAKLDERSREAYMFGGAPVLYLLTATSAAEAASRMSFLTEMNRRDAVLAAKVHETEDRLARIEGEVVRARQVIELTKRRLELDQKELRRTMAESVRLVAGLRERVDQIQYEISTIRPFSVCPVVGPVAIADDFGIQSTIPRRKAATTSIRATTCSHPWVHRSSRRSTARPRAPPSNHRGQAVEVFGEFGYVYNAHLSAFGQLGPVEAGDDRLRGWATRAARTTISRAPGQRPRGRPPRLPADGLRLRHPSLLARSAGGRVAGSAPPARLGRRIRVRRRRRRALHPQSLQLVGEEVVHSASRSAPAERIRSSSTSFALQTRSSWPSRTLHRRSMPWSIARRIRSSSCVWRRGSGRRPRRSHCGSAWPPRGSRSGAPRSPVRTSPPSARGPRRSAARALQGHRDAEHLEPLLEFVGIPRRRLGLVGHLRDRAFGRELAGTLLRLLAPASRTVVCPVSGLRWGAASVWTMSSASPEGGDDRGRRCRDLDSRPATRTVDPYHVRSAPFSMGDDLGAVHLDLDRLPHVRARTFLTARP